MSGRVVDWAALPWPDVEALLASDPVLLCPLGSVEAHGPHLPLDTDLRISQGAIARAARILAEDDGEVVALLPPIHYGVTEFARGFAGTLGIRPATVEAVVRDVAEAALDAGAQRLCFVNNHLEPAHVQAVRQGARAASSGRGGWVGVFDPTERRFARALTAEFRSGACHAGQYETSLVLAHSGGAVRQAQAKALAPNPASLSVAIREGKGTFAAAGGPEAYFGAPALATAQEGEATFALLAGMIAQLVRERAPA